MGREFLNVFSGWASEYDSFVEGKDDQYREVFRGYDTILETIVSRSGKSVMEFGIGTGNLTLKLLEAEKNVWAVEPSDEMRQLAIEKLPSDTDIKDGDMQEYPVPAYPIDTIVSSYVFHHLNDSEKKRALSDYASRLSSGGKVIFADTLFASEEEKDAIIEEATALEYDELVEDLNREYYPMLSVVYNALKEAGFTQLSFTQMNAFVWIFEGTVKK
ncbi:MAG: class I SAM-dependent methyltransferase [Alkalibacterium sp.]|nr:class I SAM-dependent methyltransferase [Alkalibacterium sp.]